MSTTKNDNILDLEKGKFIKKNNGDLAVNTLTTLYTEEGYPIDAHIAPDGNYHIGTAIIQSIYTSINNSTTENIAAGETFTGTSEDTLGVNGIQVYIFTDRDTTVYVDQSLDNINWDITDTFNCLANSACTRTFKSDAPYFRLRVKNVSSSATTVVRIAAGLTPIINPLPRSLTSDDRLKVETTITSNQELNRHVDVTPSGELATINPVRLIGTNFDGTTKDTNFWTETTTGSATVTQNGEIELQTGTTANSTASYQTVRRARFVVGSAMRFQAITKLVTTTVGDNIARLGAFDTTDGFFFQRDGSTYAIGTRNNSVDTLVESGSFNGNYGPNYVIDAGYHKKEIEWTPRGVFFYIDNKLLHKLNNGHYSRFLTLPARMELINYDGNTTDVIYDILSLAIQRLGNLSTNPTYKYLGTNATTICKYGAGVLHNIVNLDNAGDVAVYDGLAAVGGTEIAVIDTAKALGTLSFNAPFSNGLTIVVTGGAKITVTYE